MILYKSGVRLPFLYKVRKNKRISIAKIENKKIKDGK